MRPRVGSGADPAAPRHAANVSTSATISDQHSQTSPLFPHGDERDRLDDLVRAAAAGCAEVLRIIGERGIGKSVALDYAVQQVTGFRVRRIRAVAAELELPYAGLRLLCAPVLDNGLALLAAHRNALAAAFGLTSEPRPEVTVVGLATLDLLTHHGDGQATGPDARLRSARSAQHRSRSRRRWRRWTHPVQRSSSPQPSRGHLLSSMVLTWRSVAVGESVSNPGPDP
jgi:hypothetical protein